MSRLLFDDDPPPAPTRKVISISELNVRIRSAMQERFPSVWVSGEVNDLARPGSGHIYLTLKDDNGQIKAGIWRNVAMRLPFELQDGMEVVCEGSIDVYPPRGTYQLILRQVEPRGIGALQLALVQLREKLGAEGLFDPARKRPLPRFPRRLAVVTSPTGAAIHDFLQVQSRRWQRTDVIIVPTRVQGAEAAAEIVEAIEAAQRLRPLPDALVVTRGGGSLEDLWCFNDERVVRALAACCVPTVSAIGHEIDVTLCDLAADMRALTPSEAAERLSPSSADVLAELGGWQRALNAALARKTQLARLRLDAIAQRPVLARPVERLHDLARRLDEREQRLHHSMQNRIAHAQRQVSVLSAQLEGLSPLATLGRGYSLTYRAEDGTLVRRAQDVQSGDELWTQLAGGRIHSRVLQSEVNGRDALDDSARHTLD